MNAPASIPAPSRPRSAYIDTLRGVAIFGVAIIHFGGSFVNPGNAWTPSFYLGLITGQVFNFAVPLFVFLSGLLAAGPAKGTLWDYYRGRLVRIFIPYLAASIASFFLLNHMPEWEALEGVGAHATWLARKLFYYGVEPTLYFVPLILQLYLLQPLLKALPRWIQSATGVRVETIVVILSLLFLTLHLVLGILCFRGTLSYYTWCRPCSLFWLVYFFCGLHFKVLAAFFSRRALLLVGGAALLVAAVALAADFHYLTDRSAVGANFELNNMDFAYSRPQLLAFDLAMVVALSLGVALGWNWRPSLVSFLGQYTLDIYLWHILLLYEGAWRHADVLESCKQMPELIVIISAAACLLIAGVRHLFPATIALVRQYRLVLVRQSW